MSIYSTAECSVGFFSFNDLYLIQVRVFIHSASGQVTEQELPQSPKEEKEESTNAETEQKETAQKEPPPKGVVQGEEPVDASLSHNYTTTKSEAMEMTCEPSTTKYDDEPYIEQVWKGGGGGTDGRTNGLTD